MKPLRRLMSQIEATEIDDSKWFETVDQAKTPKPGAIELQDFEEAIQSTKSSA